MKTASPAFPQVLLATSMLARSALCAPVPTPATPPVRPAAVAGLFYPKDSKVLAGSVDDFLAAAATNSIGGVRALICPHAGYEYSGTTAARAYRQVVGRRTDTVIILAASHYALFGGVSVPLTESYETPLGRVPVSAKARQLAVGSPFVLEPKCRVQRPQWSSISSRPTPAAGEDTPETWEHSVEVQLPFLQRALSNFSILPVVFGRGEPAEVARALAPMVDERTLVVASTDLSHYRPYAEAGTLDRQTVKWICELDLKALESPEAEERACGRMPVLTLLHLAKLKNWKPHLLDYRNSGDTAGDKSRVVGYCAVAFTEAEAASPSVEPQKTTPPSLFNAAEREFLLGLARQSLMRATAAKGMPEVSSNTVPEACGVAKGCFVTLKKSGQLRGCMGNILPASPLYRAVLENARSAALRDPRFSPVTAEEAPRLRIEVSVLTEPEPLPFSSPDDLLAKLKPRRHGVVLRIGERAATFLPQVWEQLPDKNQFLEHLSAKAGCRPDAWRGTDVSVSVYRVESFEERE